MKQQVLLIFGLIIVGSAIIISLALRSNTPTAHSAKPITGTSTQQSTTKLRQFSAKFDKTGFSVTDPNSLWVVVNKQHGVNPAAYTPTDLIVPKVPLRVPGNESMQLRQQAATALHAMFEGASGDGLQLMLSSGYRSYAYQTALYNGYVSSLGQAAADTQSARPGHSEHQTGLAADIEPAAKNCELSQCFADTPEGKWLVANAHKYGFLLRYTNEITPVTGYTGEPWHYRYVGVPLATELHDSGVSTLEQFFNVTGGVNY